MRSLKEITLFGYDAGAHFWISANNLVTEGEKAVVVLNTSWPVEDEFSQAASVFSVWGSWTPLLAGLTAAGIVLGLVGLVLVTLQAGRNCYNREIRLYSFDGILRKYI